MTSVTLFSIALLVLPLLAVLFAAAIGGRAERIGAAIFACALLLTWATQLLGVRAPYVTFLAIDFAATLGLGLLMLRYPDKLWPGVAACAQLFVVAFSATRAIDFPLSESAYLYALNLSGGMVWVALGAGACASRWYRRPESEWDVAARKLGAT